MSLQAFRRIHFQCPECGGKGLISSAAINLTTVILYGFCTACCLASTKTYDLLEVDRNLNDGLQANDDSRLRGERSLVALGSLHPSNKNYTDVSVVNINRLSAEVLRRALASPIPVDKQFDATLENLIQEGMMKIQPNGFARGTAERRGSVCELTDEGRMVAEALFQTQ